MRGGEEGLEEVRGEQVDHVEESLVNHYRGITC